MTLVIPRARSRTAPAGPALAWRVVRDGPRSGASNMARDHALALRPRQDEGVLRLYGWSRPTVSLGRNEVATGRYSLAAAREAGVDWVRRPTGGRAVLHRAELTYALIVPARALGGPRTTYRRVNEALARALRAMGADVGISASGRTLGLDAGPCFQSPAEGEVVAAGRKLVGSAQARIGGALLQHGAIVLRDDQTLLTELAADAGVVERAATLTELLGEVDERALEAAVLDALEDELGGSWADGDFEEIERSDAERLERERYDRQSWTWRR